MYYGAGYVTPSFGLNCAYVAGVKDSIIQRAQAVSQNSVLLCDLTLCQNKYWCCLVHMHASHIHVQ